MAFVEEFFVSDIRVVVDRAPRLVPAGSTAGEILAQTGTEGIAVWVNGTDLRDLTWAPDKGDRIEAVALDSADGRAILRHSTAHVLAQAVQELFPEAKLGIGPPIENGFYYDFDVQHPFTPDDLTLISAKMKEIVRAGQRFSRRLVAEHEAKIELADEPYKLELVAVKGSTARDDEANVEVGAGELTMYDNLDAQTGRCCWSDLCRGPHLPTTRHIPAFRLTRTAAAYWRGSERNPQLQRIYGTAWESHEALQAHLDLLAEAEKRDHRKLGEELDLFTFSPEIGRGLPLWLPKGTIIRNELENWAKETEQSLGYQRVATPHITKSELYYISGHLPYYQEDIYSPIDIEGESYYLKPMNCPHHHMIYKSRPRSYRELPLRLAENGTVYRYERSGQLYGMMRVRGFTQNDAHIYCAEEQAKDEFLAVMKLHELYYTQLGIKDFYMVLALRDPAKTDKYHGDDEMWHKAERLTRQAIEESGIPHVEDVGGAAHYGPKIDFIIRSAVGKELAASTNQIDLYMPSKFGLAYTTDKGEQRNVAVIHRAPFGSFERFVAFLIEHYAGAFPPWLSPVQVVGIPIADAHVPYLQEVAARLRSHGIRVEVDTSDDRMQKKIRNAQRQKVPYMLLAGDKDISQAAVSFRYRSGEQRNGVPIEEAIAEIVRAVQDRVLG